MQFVVIQFLTTLFILVTQGIVLQHRFNTPRQFCFWDSTNSSFYSFRNVYSCNYIYSFCLRTSRYFDYLMMCLQHCCLNFQVKISFEASFTHNNGASFLKGSPAGLMFLFFFTEHWTQIGPPGRCWMQCWSRCLLWIIPVYEICIPNTFFEQVVYTFLISWAFLGRMKKKCTYDFVFYQSVFISVVKNYKLFMI